MQRENNGLRKCFGGYWIFLYNEAKQSFRGGLVLLHCSPDGGFVQWENNGPLGVPGGEQLAKGTYNVEPVGAKSVPKTLKWSPWGCQGHPGGGLVGP